MRMRTLRSATEGILLLTAILMLIVKTEAAVGYAVNAVNLCLNKVIPSLFPFLVLSSLLLQMKLPQKIGASLGRRFGGVFGESGAGVLLLGMIAGFPVGASAAAELYREGGCEREEAQRMMALSNLPSPGFILAVGGTTFRNRAAAFVLLAAVDTAAIWLAAMGGRRSVDAYRTTKRKPVQTVPLSSCFSKACEIAVRSMLLICAYVVVFGVITGFLPKNALLRGGFELTTGIYSLSGWSAETAAHAALLLGFGGLCVAAQTLCFAEEAGLSMRYYIKMKLCQGILSAIHVFAVMKLRYWALLLAAAEIAAAAIKNSGKKSKKVLYSE